MVALGIAFEHEDAFTEDAIQEALLGALESGEWYRDPAPVESWG
jgi:hypothetical protein